jgi:hypothetical protein
MSLRNVSTGTAVLHGWWMSEHMGAGDPPPLDEMSRLSRDIFVAAGDIGFWQGSFRDPESDGFREARRQIEERETLGVSVMYGDLEGGQRTITRFALIPRDDGAWMISAGRVWNIDRADPR